MSSYKKIFPVLRYFYGVLWKNSKPYFFATAVQTLVNGAAPFINIFLPKLLIDQLLGDKNANAIIAIVAAIVLLNLAAAGIRNLAQYISAKHNNRIDNLFREILAEKCMTMDFAHTENADILQRNQKARRALDGTYASVQIMTVVLTGLISAIITFAGTVAVIGALSPIMLGIIVLVTAGNLIIVQKLSKGSTTFYKTLIELNRHFGYYTWDLKEFKFGKDIRIYNGVPLIKSHLDEYVDKEWWLQRKFNRQQNKYTVFTSLLSAVQQGIVYGYLGVRVVLRIITVGEFQMLVTAALSFGNSLRGVVENVIATARTAEYMHDYVEFVNLPDTANAGTSAIPETLGVIEFRNVSFKYPNAENYSIRNVSITIRPGSKLSVVGQNGAGKTTFIKLLCRLYDPTEGEILLGGVDVRNYDLESYRKLLSVVFQDFKLFAFSLRENIAVSNRTNSDGAIITAIEQAGFAERFSALEKSLDTPIYKSFDENGVEFSGGESQKIAIARAVYKDAAITVLDEPTAALDPLAEYDIYSRFDNLIGTTTAIYISHRLSSCRFCDNVAVFKDGAIVQYGSHDELVFDANGEYAAMWNAQAKYYE
jgi:ATP-binding cassette subfamily B protein/ATP-binding cassette subfamily C protein